MLGQLLSKRRSSGGQSEGKEVYFPCQLRVSWNYLRLVFIVFYGTVKVGGVWGLWGVGTHKIWAQVYLCAAAATFSRCFYDLTDGN